MRFLYIYIIVAINIHFLTSISFPSAVTETELTRTILDEEPGMPQEVADLHITHRVEQYVRTQSWKLVKDCVGMQLDPYYTLKNLSTLKSLRSLKEPAMTLFKLFVKI